MLDEFFAEQWKAAGNNSNARIRHRRRGGATYRLVRYPDDFVVMVAGAKAHAEGVREKVAEVLSPVGLRLSEEKTDIVHLDEGFTFLGFWLRGWTVYFQHGVSSHAFHYLSHYV
ncbi:reverse transcriptase domain-containing protein [Streptomyces alanosinicus]|uniref:reverse transcriptase domain-containing protein n=1 Tax=Streptomyces alanosinicus TaxID=68171 RepID=UPI001E4D4803|nr:reverse transcriptase domain-containing protein [Streptomyces alanosinicus]